MLTGETETDDIVTCCRPSTHCHLRQEYAHIDAMNTSAIKIMKIESDDQTATSIVLLSFKIKKLMLALTSNKSVVDVWLEHF